MFGFAIVRSDDYVKIDEVRQERDSHRTALDQLKQETEILKRANESEKKGTDLRKESSVPVSRIEHKQTPARSATSKAFCEQASNELQAVQQEKKDLDAEIERLIKSGGYVTYVNRNNEPITTYGQEREISEKKRQSDSLTADIVSLRGQLGSCFDD